MGCDFDIKKLIDKVALAISSDCFELQFYNAKYSFKVNVQCTY